jgi:hypothetical protein
MKTDLRRVFSGLGQVLTEVPGWPDAPRWMRVRRLLPVLLPCLGALGLFCWDAAFREPVRAAERAAHAHLFALESDMADLRLRWSEQQAGDLATRAEEARGLLLDGPAVAPPWLRAFGESLGAQGWEVSFQIYDAQTRESGAPAGPGFVPALVRLKPAAARPEPLRPILQLLEQFSSSGKRIDLTRLVIRADEPGRPSLEINLRVAFRSPDEKTAQ